jgi:hypothetical protein
MDTARLLEASAKRGYNFPILPKPTHPQEILDFLAGVRSH